MDLVKELFSSGKQITRRDFLKTAALTALTLGPVACSPSRPIEVKKKAEIPTSPTGIPQELKIQEFSQGIVDFTFDENIAIADRWEIKDHFEKAYPLLKKLFGIDPVPMKGKERLQLHIATGDFSDSVVRKNETIHGHVSGFDIEGTKTMYLLDPGNKVRSLHEFAHLFTNIPEGIEYSPWQEGFAVLAEMVVGQQLGLIKSADEIISFYIGPLFEPDSFNNPDTLPAIHFADNPGMAAIRYIASGLAWKEVYDSDPNFFSKLHRNLSRLLKEKKGEIIAIADLFRDAFKGDFSLIVDNHPVLNVPKPGKKLAFAPIAGGKLLVLVCYEVGNDGLETVLSGIIPELKIAQDARILYRGTLSPSDENGVINIFEVPQFDKYTGKRVPESEKTSKISFTATVPFAEQNIVIPSFPLAFKERSSIHCRVNQTV